MGGTKEEIGVLIMLPLLGIKDIPVKMLRVKYYTTIT